MSHVFRLYEGARVVEFEWEAGPLPTDDGGMQVVVVVVVVVMMMMMMMTMTMIVTVQCS